jgi:hypothetical protein
MTWVGRREAGLPVARLHASYPACRRPPPRTQRHGKAVKAWPDDLGPPVVFATDAARGEETGETHAERLERLRRQAALDAEDADGGAPQGGPEGRVGAGMRFADMRFGKRARDGIDPLPAGSGCL